MWKHQSTVWHCHPRPVRGFFLAGFGAEPPTEISMLRRIVLDINGWIPGARQELDGFPSIGPCKHWLTFLQGSWLFKNKPIIFRISVRRKPNLNAWYVTCGLLGQFWRRDAQSLLDDELAAAGHYTIDKLWENGSNVDVHLQSNCLKMKMMIQARRLWPRGNS